MPMIERKKEGRGRRRRLPFEYAPHLSHEKKRGGGGGGKNGLLSSSFVPTEPEYPFYKRKGGRESRKFVSNRQ